MKPKKESLIYKAPPAPGLAEFKVKGISVRDQCARLFVNGIGDNKFRGLKLTTFHTWPQFVSGCDCSGKMPRFTPSRLWNHWLERAMKAFTNEQYAARQGDSVFRLIVLTGVPSSGKTFSTGLYATIWWAVDPLNSMAVLTSTSKDMARNRVWNVVRNFASTAQDYETGSQINLGHLQESDMRIIIKGARTPNPHGIQVLAVERGETLKAVDKLKGMHAERMLVVVDEANSVPDAIFHTIANYRKGCLDLTIIVLGNPVSRLDPHGRLCEPENGWEVFNDTMIEWKNKAHPDWQFDPGVVVRYDGRDSPNVAFKQELYPYLYGHHNWISADRQRGTYKWYGHDRGLWPPSGFVQAVLSESLVIQHKAAEKKVVFQSIRHHLASLDPGFGGDACIAAFAVAGDLEDNRFCVAIEEFRDITIDLSLPTASDYQVARAFIKECKLRGIQPKHASVLATGTGRGVYAIVCEEWSDEVLKIEEGGAPSELPCSQDDPRPAKDLYDRRVTELWFSVHSFVISGQLKGLNGAAVTQFCNRTWTEVGRKISLEKKEDYKIRVGSSPNEADAVAGIVEIVRRTMGPAVGKLSKAKARVWENLQKEVQDLHSSGYDGAAEQAEVAVESNAYADFG